MGAKSKPHPFGVDEVVFCLDAFDSPLFGEVPVGSLWAGDHPVVLASPENFQSAEETNGDTSRDTES
jgi:hypothetical protein